MCLNCFSLMMAMDDPWRYSSCEIPVSSARQPYPADISCNTHATPRLHHALPPPPPHSSSSSSCTPHPPPLHRIQRTHDPRDEIHRLYQCAITPHNISQLWD